MKRIKNYIQPDLAKKKIARYKYWSIKDENGITIVSSDDNPDSKSFGEVLDKIIADNVDAEVQIKYGTNEQSSRQNPPFFIQVNETIEWVEPEEDSTVQINGVPHKIDKNGNVNINLTSPTNREEEKHQAVQIDTFRQELDIQLKGIQREHELKEERLQLEMHNKLLEQNIKFKEMLLAERETRCKEREEALAVQQAQLDEKEKEMTEDVKGYVKQIPNALGGVIKDWIKSGAKEKPLSGTEKEKKTSKKRRAVNFSIEEDDEIQEEVSTEETDNQITLFEEDLKLKSDSQEWSKEATDPEIVEEAEEIEKDNNIQNTTEDEGI